MVNSSVAAMMAPVREANSPTRQAGHIVQAVDLFDAKTLHESVLDHFVATGRRLLPRAGRSRPRSHQNFVIPRGIWLPREALQV